MDNLRVQSNYNSFNKSPTVENIALKDRITPHTHKAKELTYTKVYNNFVDYIFKEAQKELQEKIDDEKDPITW